ncbi:ABC transporter permease [Cohnella terricola]|uniref:ABC transporter permease subunit n=1 Tax=Cohnella terricola TaxID=1289167 RepID=A0A559JWM3_9BACL|nr:ABC transporter permease [Cohnella terricola]TVY04293.1 ABC transporter permease subunit [Cohnella terricola]
MRRILFPLLRNELTKLFARPRSVMFLVFLAAFAVISGIIAEKTTSVMGAYGLAIRTLDIGRYFVLAFTVVLAAQTIADEFRDGTIKLLLIRPRSRGAIMLSKWGAVVTLLCMSLLLLLLASLAVGVLLLPRGTDGYTLWVVIRVYLYTLPNLLFYVGLSLLVGVLTASVPLSITLVVILNFMGSTFTRLASGYPWSQWLVFRHLDLRGHDPSLLVRGTVDDATVGWLPLTESAAIVVVYLIVCLAVTAYVFGRKEVK